MHHPQLAAGDRIWTHSACGKHFAVRGWQTACDFFWYGNPFAKLEKKLITEWLKKKISGPTIKKLLMCASTCFSCAERSSFALFPEGWWYWCCAGELAEQGPWHSCSYFTPVFVMAQRNWKTWFRGEECDRISWCHGQGEQGEICSSCTIRYLCIFSL